MVIAIAKWIFKIVDLRIDVKEDSVRLVVYVGGVQIVDRIWRVFKKDKEYSVNSPKGVL